MEHELCRVSDRPFDTNAVYTYHKFWAHPTREVVQEYVNFSNRWRVPVVIGETGEYSNEWNAAFRSLNERFGIGWCFWTYKNLDSDTTVRSIKKPEGWDKIAAVGSGDTAHPPSREEARAILAAYLDAARFGNTRLNGDYLKSLGLAAP